jgi:hypothetical protein
MVILGISGKTQTLKEIAHELFHTAPSRSIVLDFQGDQQIPNFLMILLFLTDSW